MVEKNEIKPYIRKVDYYETDQMSVVHHSNYIRWFEAARCDWMEQTGYSYAELEKHGIMSPVMSVKCNYKNMTRFGETVRIETNITLFTGIKMTVSYVVYGEEGEIKVDGETTHCFIDQDYKLISLKKANKPMYQIFKNLTE